MGKSANLEERCPSCLMLVNECLIGPCDFCGVSGCDLCVFDGDAMYNPPTCCQAAREEHERRFAALSNGVSHA